jgi:uncharacterized protein YdiU (UPF0061 family)
MSIATRSLFAFDNSFARELEELCVPWRAATVPDPHLLALNDELAVQLGADPEALRAPGGVEVLVGNAVPDGASPVAQAYAGHQFGSYSPRLGDGRALLLGEVLDSTGARRDLHLKGSGRTPFARGGDGKAVVGPMLREHVIGEAMHALGIPTTRALAVVGTGERVVRETVLPGAVLTRIAASHLRVGTFEYAARLPDPQVLQRLTRYAIARHHPDAADALELFERVLEVQAALVAQWMLVGFVHGVMNTDNMAISGETIDYGPCAFMDAFDTATVFSSIDHGGRYAYGNQPVVAQWNLARLAEALLPLIDEVPERAVERATAVLETFPDRYGAHWRAGMRAKLAVADDELIEDFVRLMQAERADHTSTFRRLSAWLRGEALLPDALHAWAGRWREHGPDPDAMDRVNPVYVPRNHLVEDALTQATVGDLEPYRRLVEVLSDPYTERPGLEAYAAAGPEDGPYVTYCGT